MTDDLARIEPWIGALIAKLGPGQRRRLSVKLGQHLRRENAKRIAANVEPDGGAMEPRKPRPQRRAEVKSGRVKKKGKMFPKIRKAQALKVRARPDGVEIGFANSAIEKTAAEHHFGLRGFVGKGPDGKTIRTQYPARRLLGFGPEDPEAITDLILAHLTR